MRGIVLKAGVQDQGEAQVGEWGEDPTAESFSQSVDLNGILWERFTPAQQLHEIAAAWPATTNEGDRTRS